jgi:hypothetical protein
VGFGGRPGGDVVEQLPPLRFEQLQEQLLLGVLEWKCWYRTGLVTPAASAIPSIDVSW